MRRLLLLEQAEEPRLQEVLDDQIRFDGELVMLNLENERYYGLDDIGTHCWDALVASGTVAAAAAQLAAVFDVDEAQLVGDLLELVGDLAEHGIVAVSEA